MKFILSISAFFIIHSVFAQDTLNPRLFNELSVSGNYSLVLSSKHRTHPRAGFGISVSRSFHLDRKINPVIGFEFLQTRFHSEETIYGESDYYSNADFSYNQLRVPFSVRFHFGNKTTFFVEPGAFANIILADYIEGTHHTNVNGSEKTESSKSTIKSNPGIGLSLGFGIQTPLKKGVLLFRLDENAGSGRTYLAQGSSNESTIFYNHYLHFSIIYRLPAKQ